MGLLTQPGGTASPLIPVFWHTGRIFPLVFLQGEILGDAANLRANLFLSPFSKVSTLSAHCCRLDWRHFQSHLCYNPSCHLSLSLGCTTVQSISVSAKGPAAFLCMLSCVGSPSHCHRHAAASANSTGILKCHPATTERKCSRLGRRPASPGIHRTLFQLCQH